ncbi:MAG: trypsin-like peptidase domain-containing protein [Chloroflexi bacterium]|nr:MAG: trypsin-like peptidase domain-containing protein [Chloroflexota bacterium]
MKVVRFGVSALLALAVIANGALLAGIVLTREPAPKPLTTQRVAKASAPAIVLIQSEYAITTSLPQITISTATWDALDKPYLNRYFSGQMSWEQVQAAEHQTILDSPDQYFSAGTTASDTWNLFATGSGFFVTQDGYLVTAAHVVSASKAEIHDGIIADTKNATWTADVKNTIKKNWANWQISNTQVDIFLGFWQRWIARYITVDAITSKYYLASGSTVQAGDNMLKSGARATVVSVDPTVGGHDIAILKADVSGTPTLPLASATPHIGDATIKVAYPRVPYLQESVPLDQAVPTVMTEGHVTRQNPQQGGAWTAWGTDAEFTHGDSGGPVLDAKGNVMGLVSFAAVDSSGNQLPGQGYFIPAQYINEDLAKSSIAVAKDPKDLTNTYYKALAEGDNQRYRTELAMLENIDARSSFDSYIKDDISRAQTEVLTGQDKTPPELTVYVLPAAGSAGGVILLVMLVWLGLAIAGGRRRPAVVIAQPEVPAAAPVMPAPVVTANGPASDEVTSPQEVLRDSTTIAQSASPEALPTDVPTPTD